MKTWVTRESRQLLFKYPSATVSFHDKQPKSQAIGIKIPVTLTLTFAKFKINQELKMAKYLSIS